MKIKLLFFAFILSTFSALSQTICDSVTIKPDTFYIHQSTDTVVFDTLMYIGQRDISYSICYFLFQDTTYIDIKEIAVTHGISGPFTFTKWNGYKIIHNSPNIPINTVVNAQYGVYHSAIPPPPAIDCLLPVTFIINATTGIESLYKKIKLKIWPNPFSTIATIETNATIGNKGVSMVIFDLSGHQIKRIDNISEQQIIIDRNNLSNGIYFIYLTLNNKIIGTDKLIITD